MIDSPEETCRRVTEVISDLQSAGLGEAAQRLAQVQSTAYTTGSEWRGELCLAIQAIRKDHGLPRDLDSKLRQFLEPGFSERVVRRQLWRGILAGTILLMLGAAVVAIATSNSVERFAPFWITAAVVLIGLLWISARRVSVCPGCGTRIQQQSPRWCPYCATDLTSGVTGPKVSAVPTSPRSTLLTCPSCGNPPGGRGRYGTKFPSEGPFCSFCGEKLPI